jgi:cyanophycinase
MTLVVVSLLALVARLPAPERINPDGIEAPVLYAGAGVPAPDVKRFTEQAGDNARAIVLANKVVDEAVPGVRVAAGEATEELVKALTGDGRPALVIGEKAALLVNGRTIKVLGEGRAIAILPAGGGRDMKRIEWKSGTTADYTALRRAALARKSEPYPPKVAPVPEVPSGALVIIGGGGMTAEMVQRYIDLAGGPEARFVVLPISMPDPIPPTSDGRFLRRYGVTHIDVIKSRSPAELDKPETLELLKKANAVWFDGGRQWRFIDAYEGTKFEEELRNVLKRGGVIAGSSAGATIQGDYLCRGDPLGPNPIICEGYERGLGFLPGVGIDQHFTQRRRLPDMTRLMKTYPQLLGIGLDEATAIVVKGHVAEVMGRGKVHFYDYRTPPKEGAPDYVALPAGRRYDLKERKELESAATAPASALTFLDGLSARPIGPVNAGGRVVDVEVSENDPKTIYVGAASGGVWKTTDGGQKLQQVFTSPTTGVIGDIAVSASNPNVVWVGTGEGNPRNSVSWGDGVYKSTDAGRTWQHMGLKETRHIGRVVIHPANPDIVYVAALGHFWGPNKERGLYVTTDGGQTWTLSKFIDENTGFVDVAIDPQEPKRLYAATYCVRRDGYSGGNPATQTGPNTGLFRSEDGGKTWEKMTNGLPDRPLGRCGLAVYRKDPKIVYAVVQTDKTNVSVTGQTPKEGTNVEIGGIFRSEDYGKTWTKLNDLCPRPFYYGQIRVDPNDDKRVYVLGLSLYVSDDGGKTFPNNLQSRGTHPDHHALWIDPKDSSHLILGNDGGLYFSKDRGKTWEAQRQLPIAQYYAVAADMRRPYWVYGGLQDNGSWGGPSATRSAAGITPADWRRVAGADGFYAACDPTDSNIVYAEGQYGRVQRIDLKAGRNGTKNVQPRPGRNEAAYRFNWSTPFFLSPHDPKTFYVGANFLFKSTDRGDKWEKISPDLTRGGSGPGFGHTISTIAESPEKARILWAGTDDGRLHVTRDGGKNWADVSKNVPGVPEQRTISRIECSHFDEATAYLAIDRHRNDDLKPYLFKTTDFGATWTPVTANLPAAEPIYVVRESSKNRDLLFVGTEVGLYASLDGGKSWDRVRGGLPAVPVHDLLIHPRDRDLILATHGRGMFIIDVAALEEVTPEVRKKDAHLFAVKPAVTFEPTKPAEPPKYAAPNPPFGAVIQYYLRSAPEKPATLVVTDSSGKEVATLAGAGEAGFHRVVWNLRGKDDKLVAAGDYTLTLRVGTRSLTATIRVEN